MNRSSISDTSAIGVGKTGFPTVGVQPGTPVVRDKDCHGLGPTIKFVA